MDVELRDLLADYSPAIRSWLTELGLETCLDVRHMWQSAAAMESEWSDGPGQSQGADSSLQVASLYAEAVRRSAVTARKRVLDLTMERQSRFVSQDARRNVARLAPAPSSSKPKMLLLHRQSACDVTVVTSADPVPRSAPSADAQKAWKIKALFCIACEIFLDPADIGAANLDFFDEQAVSQASDLAMTSAQRLSPKRLAAIMATLRRWKAFAVASAWSVCDLEPTKIAAFLKSVSKGGPTAASAVFSALQWVNDNLGGAFPL